MRVTTSARGNKGRKADKTRASPRAAQDHPPRTEVAALEARLIDDPTDDEAWMVYGDLLQKLGDPRGELIALQAAAQSAGAPKAAHAAVAKFFARRVPALLGTLARHVRRLDNLASPPFVWKHGFIHRVALDGGSLACVVDEVLRHASGRFVAEIAFQTRHLSQAVELFDILGQHAPPVLHELDVLAPVDLELGGLWTRVPRLRRLFLTARSLEFGDLALPELRHARFRALTLSPACVDAIAAAPWPELERLELRIGSQLGAVPAAFENLEPLLRRADLPALTHLKIRRAPFAGAICRALVTSPLAARLQVLDLSHGTVTPQDVNVLAAATGAFTKLRELWIPAAALWNDGAKRLAGIATHVISDHKAPLDALDSELDGAA